MGGGISADVQRQAFMHVGHIRDFYTSLSSSQSEPPNNLGIRLSAWSELLKFAEQDHYRVPLLDTQLELLQQIINTLQCTSNLIPWEEKILVAKCCWYLSRSFEADVILASSSNLCESMLTSLQSTRGKRGTEEYQRPFFAFFGNLMSARESSSLLQRQQSELCHRLIDELLFYLDHNTVEYSCYEVAIKTLGNICMYLQPDLLEYMVQSQVHVSILEQIRQLGATPKQWKHRNGAPALIISFVRGFSYYPQGAAALRHAGSVGIFESLVATNEGEALSAAVILSFVDGSNERSLLEQHPSIESLLVDCFEAALDGGEGHAHTRMSKLWGYNWSFWFVFILSGALKILAVSDSNKAILVRNTKLLLLLIRQLRGFVQNEPAIVKILHQIPCEIGGGGEDYESATNTLETLLHLSYHYESDTQLTQEYMLSSLGLNSLLTALMELPRERKVTSDMKRHATALWKRLRGSESAAAYYQQQLPSHTSSATSGTLPPSPSRQRLLDLASGIVPMDHPAMSNSQDRKHVMISYAWGGNKPLVVQLTNQLRRMGFDVWRDDDGSQIAPRLSGDIDDSLAKAIQLAHTVIICVSKAYKESVTCRSEAQYCRAKQRNNQLKMLYVMMDANYTTQSNPEQVDGWLAFMVVRAFAFSFLYCYQIS